MVRVTFVFALALVLCIPLSAHFPQEWENSAWRANNTYIFHAYGKEVWFPGVFNKPLTDLGLETLKARVDSDTFDSYLISLQAKRDLAFSKAAECSSRYGAIRLNPNHVLAQSLKQSVGGTRVDGALDSLFMLPDEFVISTSVAIGGNVGGFSGVIFLLMKDLRSAELLAACDAYGAAWRDTMSTAVGLLDFSYSELQKEWGDATTSYLLLAQSGVCDADYYYGGRDACRYAENKFHLSGAQASSLSGTLGVRISATDAGLRNGLVKGAPDTSQYGEYLALIWGSNGSISEARYVRSITGEALLETERDLEGLLGTLRQKESHYAARISDIGKERPSKITGSRLLFGVVTSESQQSIATSYASIQADFARARNMHGNARQTSLLKKNGYLKQGITDANEALYLYDSIDARLVALLSDIDAVVLDKKTEAFDAITSFESVSEGSFIHERARAEHAAALDAFQKGDAAKAYGDRFELYEEAAYHARFAKNLFENRPFEATAGIAGAREELRTLIQAAETDGIDVAYETQEFALLEYSDEPWVLDALRDIEARIISKARVVFDPLLARRAAILDDIRRGGEWTADLATTVAHAENGHIASDGTIDYPGAVGSLQALKAVYDDVELELESGRVHLVLNSLITDYSVITGPVRIDAPTPVFLDFVIKNPTGYGIDNAAVSFDTQFPFTLLVSDVVEGKEHVEESLSDLDSTTFLIRSIEPYGSLHIRVAPSVTLARTVKRTTGAVGRGDLSAQVVQDSQFDLAIDSAILADDSVLVDGLPYQGGVLSSGRHTLHNESILFDAYSIDVDGFAAQKIGISATIRYTYVISPNIDLERTLVQAEFDHSEVKHLEVLSLTGEPVKNVRQFPNGLLLFDVHGLRAHEKSRILVQYEIENVSEKITADIASLKRLNLTDGERAGLLVAEDYLGKNRTEESLETLEKLRRTIEIRTLEENKLAQRHSAIYAELEKQLSDLTAIYEKYRTTVDSPFMERIGARIASLTKALGENKDPNTPSIKNLESLEADFEESLSKDIRTHVLGVYNGLKKEFISLGGSYEKPLSFTVVERSLQALQEEDTEGHLRLLGEMQSARDELEEKKSEDSTRRAGLKAQYGRTKQEIQKTLATYKKLVQAASGSPFAYLFSVNYKDVEKTLRDTDNLFEKSAPYEEVSARVASIESVSVQLETVLAAVSHEAKSRFASLERALRESDAPQGEKDKVAARLQRMKELIVAEEYVNALKASDAIIKDISALKKTDDNSLTVLSITALFIVGACVAYFYNSRKGKPESAPLKPLRRMEE